jgi:hypothetical protein
MTTSYTWDLSAINLSINGLQIFEAGADDNLITITMPKFWASKQGVHGDSITHTTGETTATFTLNIISEAAIVKDLIDIINADKRSSSGSGKGDFYCENQNSGIVIKGKSRILGYPDEIAIGAEAQAWTFSGEIYNVKMDVQARG